MSEKREFDGTYTDEQRTGMSSHFWSKIAGSNYADTIEILREIRTINQRWKRTFWIGWACGLMAGLGLGFALTALIR